MREAISDELRSKVLLRDGFVCRYCGYSPHRFDIDHVYPCSKGGETTLENLVASCPRCNRSKGDRVGVWPFPIGHFKKSYETLGDFQTIALQLVILALLYSGVADASTAPLATLFEISLAGILALILAVMFAKNVLRGAK